MTFTPAKAYALDVLAELARFPADVVAVDYMVIGGAIGAEKARLPTALLMHTPYPLPLEGVPPFGLGLKPARTRLARTRDRVLGRLVTWRFERLGLGPLNEARWALGLELLARALDQLEHADRVLVMTASAFDFAAKVRLPENVRYVGPGLDDPAWAAPYDAPALHGVSDPLVVVGLGSTFQNQGALTQRVIEALDALPVRGLVTLGGVFAVQEFAPAPNVAVLHSAPHSALFPAARVVISHGGHGTVMKALSFGVPLLFLPLGRDQADNAARVEVSGAGLHLRPSASASQITAAIRRLLETPAFSEAARRLAADIARDNTADLAVRELEALASAARVEAVA